MAKARKRPRGVLLHFSGQTLSFLIPSPEDEEKWKEQLRLAEEAIRTGQSYGLRSEGEYYINISPFTFVGWEIGDYYTPQYKALQSVIEDHKRQCGGDEPWRQSLEDDDE